MDRGGMPIVMKQYFLNISSYTLHFLTEWAT